MNECIRCRRPFAAVDSEICDECLMKQALKKEISPMYIEKRIEQLEDVIPRLDDRNDRNELQREYETLIDKVQADIDMWVLELDKEGVYLEVVR